MLSIDLIWIARTPDLAPDAPQVFTWSYVKDNVRFVIERRGLGIMISEVLRVFHRSQILYDIPIQDLIEESKRLSAALKQSGAEVPLEHLPISGKAKYPSIALRYVLPIEGKVRRLQFKFASTNNYDQAINHLQELGLQIDVAARSNHVSCSPSKLSETSKRPLTSTSTSTTPTSFSTSFREVTSSRPLSAQPSMTSAFTPKVRPSSPLRSSFTASSVSGGANVFNSAAGEYRPSSATRPETPALLFDHPSELPPRRELPFQRPDSSPKSRESESSRPSSRQGPPQTPTNNTSMLPPLPKPTILKNIPPLIQPSHDINTYTSPTKSPASKRASNKTPNQRSRANSAVLTVQDGLTFSRSNNFRPSSSSSVAYDRPSSAMSATSEQLQPSEQQNRLSTPFAPYRAEQQYNLEANDADNGTRSSHTSLADYASRPDEDRINFLNRSLLQYLEDPDFLTLVGDIETAWARIAPGHG